MTGLQTKRRGFTRIELLLMISALCVLAAMGIPVQESSFRVDMRTACAMNLRVIGQTAIDYAFENDDWVIGSPDGSGAYLQGQSQAFGASVQSWDFMGPMLHRWEPNAPLPAPGDLGAVVARFNDIRSDSRFLDPANGYQARHFGGPDAGTGPMISYNTSRNQLWRESSQPIGNLVTLPSGWRPSVSLMGNPANKVFCADGSRFTSTFILPEYDLSVNAGFGGAFAADPPYSKFSHSWDRSFAPGNGGRTGLDPRIYAYRHSIGRPMQGAAADAFRMNLVFYDGHVETQGDLQSSDPQQWLPSGSVLETRDVFRDTRRAFQLRFRVFIGD